MTKKEADKIKKILRKENAVFTSTAGYFDGKELRVKVAEFVVRSYINKELKISRTSEQEGLETRTNIIKVLRALEKNGLRPEYRIEQKENNNSYGMFDCRYVVFK